jgi:hemerythrin superfamily protein
MKVTVLLKNDHESLKTMFDKFQTSAGARNQNGKKDLFNEIRRELQIHAQMEQEILYPALTATSSSRAPELISTAQHEHHAMDKLLQELGNLGAADKAFDMKMALLKDQVLQHVETEEEEIFDEVRKNLPEFRLEELGLEMEDRRKVLLTLAA